jgi:hypothetical protein
MCHGIHLLIALEAYYTARENRVEDSKPRHIEKDGTYMCRICNSIGAHI